MTRAAEYHRAIQKLALAAADDAADWLELYQRACEARRAKRLAGLIESKARIVFVQNWDFNEGRCSHADTSNYAGMYAGRFKAGSALRRLSLVGLYGEEESLIEDSQGTIRDPAVSYDGSRVLFSWRKSRSDDFHLYEYNTASGAVRQLTCGPGIADVEGTYLPNGEIAFSSTRCVIAVDCMGHPVLNLFRCDGNGKQIRRLGFDQVTTDSPSVLEDGRLIFTRWEYNDRNPVYQSPLMQMNPDGTGQAGYYNNNWPSPTALHHAKAIPGSHKVIAIATGHHTLQGGKLALIDRTQGLGGGRGIELLAPVSELGTANKRVDAFGQQGILYQYPFPLSEDEYLVSCAPWGHKQSWEMKFYGAPHFGIYYVTKQGNRELLVKKKDIASRNPCLLASRPTPPIIPDRIDPSKSTGIVYLKDVYMGDGLSGVSRGTAKRLRIVALDFKPAPVGIGKMDWSDCVTPISINGSWDVKKIVGEVDIHEDGSAHVRGPGERSHLLSSPRWPRPCHSEHAVVGDADARRTPLLCGVPRAPAIGSAECRNVVDGAVHRPPEAPAILRPGARFQLHQGDSADPRPALCVVPQGPTALDVLESQRRAAEPGCPADRRLQLVLGTGGGPPLQAQVEHRLPGTARRRAGCIHVPTG